MRIAMIHDLHLTPVNSLKAEVNIGGRQKIEPKLGFELAYIGNAAHSTPRARAFFGRIEDGFITEVALLHRHTERDEGPGWHENLLHLWSYNLKDACFENPVFIRCEHLRNLLLGSREIVEKLGLTAPKADAARDIFCTDVSEHADVVVEVAAAIQKALHANRAGEIVTQHFARDGFVEVVIMLVLPQRKAKRC